MNIDKSDSRQLQRLQEQVDALGLAVMNRAHARLLAFTDAVVTICRKHNVSSIVENQIMALAEESEFDVSDGSRTIHADLYSGYAISTKATAFVGKVLSAVISASQQTEEVVREIWRLVRFVDVDFTWNSVPRAVYRYLLRNGLIKETNGLYSPPIFDAKTKHEELAWPDDLLAEASRSTAPAAE